MPVIERYFDEALRLGYIEDRSTEDRSDEYEPQHHLTRFGEMYLADSKLA